MFTGPLLLIYCSSAKFKLRRPFQLLTLSRGKALQVSSLIKRPKKSTILFRQDYVAPPLAAPKNEFINARRLVVTCFERRDVRPSRRLLSLLLYGLRPPSYAAKVLAPLVIQRLRPETSDIARRKKGLFGALSLPWPSVTPLPPPTLVAVTLFLLRRVVWPLIRRPTGQLALERYTNTLKGALQVPPAVNRTRGRRLRVTVYVVIGPNVRRLIVAGSLLRTSSRLTLKRKALLWLVTPLSLLTVSDAVARLVRVAEKVVGRPCYAAKSEHNKKVMLPMVLATIALRLALQAPAPKQSSNTSPTRCL